jgi:hypothetical protein
MDLSSAEKVIKIYNKMQRIFVLYETGNFKYLAYMDNYSCINTGNLDSENEQNLALEDLKSVKID